MYYTIISNTALLITLTYFIYMTLKYKKDKERCQEQVADLEKDLLTLEITCDSQKYLHQEVQDKLNISNQNIENLRNTNEELKIKITSLQEKMIAQKELQEESFKAFAQAEEKYKAAFQEVSQKVMKENSVQFLTLAKTQFEGLHKNSEATIEERKKAIDSLVKLVNEQLAKIEASLITTEKNRIETFTRFSAETKELQEVQKMLRQEAAKLNKTLHAPQSRGQWGEMQLKKTVEIAGMLEYCDFSLQRTIKSNEKVIKPDMLVKLPNNQVVIVDAKTPMENILKAKETENENEIKGHMENQAKAIRQHIKTLSSKNYWSQVEESPEFVVMFLPNEGFFAEALKYDPTLLDESINNKVLPASPVTLIALLKSVSLGWQQARMTKNIKEIFQESKVVLERFKIVFKNFREIGENLNKAVESYNSALGSTQSRLMPALKRLSIATEVEPIDLPPPIEKTIDQKKLPDENDLTFG